MAEDNSVNQKLISRILERPGCWFELATNGTEAVDLYAHGHFEVVLMDCRCLRAMDMRRRPLSEGSKQDHQLVRVPIVALTAHATASDQEMYLTKPVAVEQLRAVWNRICADLPLDRQSSAAQRMEESKDKVDSAALSQLTLK